MVSFLLLGDYNSWHIEKGWNGFLPLATTKAQIERVLKVSNPETVSENEIRYASDVALVHATYSTPGCTVTDGSGNESPLPTDTVLRYDVVPRKTLTTSEIKWNPSEFLREIDIHVLGFVHYRNLRLGISIETRETEKGTEQIRNVRYFLSDDQKKKVKC